MFEKLMQRWQHCSCKGVRAGQALFNALYDIDRETANALTATELDPFYNDERIPAVLNHLAEVWRDKK